MRFLKLTVANVKLSIDEFCELTVINGAKYLHSSRSHRSRHFWRVIISILAIISFIFIDYFYDQYNRNALISVVEFVPEGQSYNFPSVFICPEDMWRNDLIAEFAYNFKEIHGLRTEVEEIVECIKIYTAITQFRNYRRENCKEFIKAIENDKDQVNLTEIFITSKDIVGNCTFKESQIDCHKNLVPFFTEHGLCFVFNSLHTDNDFQREMLKSKIKCRMIVENAAEWSFHMQVRLPETTTRNALNVSYVFQITIEQFYLKNIPNMVTLRDFPADTWRYDSNLTVLSFEIEETRSTDLLVQRPKEKRNCLDTNEFPELENYNNPTNQQLYNQDVCVIRCHEIEILKRCNCSVKLLERFENFSIPKCSFEQLNCVLDFLPKQIKNLCEMCPVDCFYNKYDSEKEYWADFGDSRFPENDFKDNAPMYEEVIIGLKYWPVYRFRITIVYNIFDLLVSFAGVGGFFFGFSFVVVNEILYFGVVRYLCNFSIRKKTLVEQMKRERTFPGPINLRLVPCKEH